MRRSVTTLVRLPAAENGAVKLKPMLVTPGPLRPDNDKYALTRSSVGPRSSAATSFAERSKQ